MFQLVTTSEEEIRFREIWTETTIEGCWIDDPYYEESIRYFILHPSHKKIIGIIEFIPCAIIPQKKLKTTYHSINFEYGDIWEIDRLTLLKEYRKKGNMKLIFKTIRHHYKNNLPDAYIGLIEKNFFISLKRFCDNDLKKVGPVWRHKNSALIPAYFPIKEVAQKKKYIYYMKIYLYFLYLCYKKFRIKWTPGLKIRELKKRIDMFFIKN
ncbi:hypothetical protein JMA_34050 [Jeotgalibacillus malaysiensis]|uniref:N-acetyltransferase domain-containing protein n=1 Tax=Jeotgalibacillus malaysiensis TaxID=1508404 RepID=A0A0B5AVH8_9BACL|nr:hypothetical protein [Jeotgalibacillus malaysiensis]AJD92722.1 hypothetical protein JMA_34050 [Jeotgalibacillus malaysiensis]